MQAFASEVLSNCFTTHTAVCINTSEDACKMQSCESLPVMALDDSNSMHNSGSTTGSMVFAHPSTILCSIGQFLVIIGDILNSGNRENSGSDEFGCEN